MPKTYQELMSSLKKEDLSIPYENIPEERGEFRAVPQPGHFRFEFPQNLENALDIIEVKKYDGSGNVIQGPDGKPVMEQRIQIVLAKEHALKIVQSKDAKYDGEDFDYRLNNIERLRSAGKDLKVRVSDLTYLFRALLPDARPQSNAEVVSLIVQHLPGKQFGADLEYSGYCNPAKDAYFAIDDGQGGVRYEPYKQEGSAENIKGCGKRVYHSAWPKENGVYAERMLCPGTDEMPAPEGWKPGEPKCGASLRPFATLVRFKA
jgi:hypothetical protein